MNDNIFPTFYKSSCKCENKSVFQIWEEGAAYKDSITPSVHVWHYRDHILRQIIGHATEGKSILSLGCGNGFVEGLLVDMGYKVNAIDLHDEAVKFSREKGVNAVVRNFYDLGRSDIKGVGCIYADGFIGHLYNEKKKISPFLDHLEYVIGDKDIYCVLSNDAPLDLTLEVQRHEAVPDFWYISIEYLTDVLKKRGFEAISSQYYFYDRPISGTRRRMIVSFSVKKR
ncbi:class I SAM-dependent methyltransferase [Billgrantia endophytica]|uniref:Oxin biosynthesis protein n=1 Tax=Billgrantia endophytica TaxID=2033802 RepID=A0A2N7UE75_9GAMM|nr:oxin biosynthesis protein [Halomonas endophytica]PMR78720.1 oxin biosynthesis protein [Halomonas endophytica]